LTEFLKRVFTNKEDEQMKINNKINTIDVLNVTLNIFNNLSGNIAGGALLANALYDKVINQVLIEINIS
jgi:hypothetical protein